MHRAPPGWIHPKVHTSADAAFAQPQCHPRRRVLEKVKTLNQNLWTLGSMGWNGMGYTAGTGVATALMNFQCLTYWHAIVLCGRLQTFHCCEERPTPAPQRHLQENDYGFCEFVLYLCLLYCHRYKCINTSRTLLRNGLVRDPAKHVCIQRRQGSSSSSRLFVDNKCKVSIQRCRKQAVKYLLLHQEMDFSSQTFLAHTFYLNI